MRNRITNRMRDGMTEFDSVSSMMDQGELEPLLNSFPKAKVRYRRGMDPFTLVKWVLALLLLVAVWIAVKNMGNFMGDAGAGFADLFGGGDRGDGKQCSVDTPPNTFTPPKNAPPNYTIQPLTRLLVDAYQKDTNRTSDGSCAACQHGYRREKSGVRTFCCNKNEGCPYQFYTKDHVTRGVESSNGVAVKEGDYNPLGNERVCNNDANAKWWAANHCSKCAFGFTQPGGSLNTWCCGMDEAGMQKCSKLSKVMVDGVRQKPVTVGANCDKHAQNADNWCGKCQYGFLFATGKHYCCNNQENQEGKCTMHNNTSATATAQPPPTSCVKSHYKDRGKMKKKDDLCARDRTCEQDRSRNEVNSCEACPGGKNHVWWDGWASQHKCCGAYDGSCNNGARA
jgi:hypothetical protein